MKKKKKKKPRVAFRGSSIVPQAFPLSPVVGKTGSKKQRVVTRNVSGRAYAHLTRDGGLYTPQMDVIRNQLTSLDLPRKRISTVMAFCKNWYIKKKTLPSMRTLRRLFELPKN